MSKVGIFSGTFDPVHKGHIALALGAIESGLDKVYFMPDMLPPHKTGVTHYAHRIAMLKLALKPYQHLHVLETTDKQFTVAKTLPKLKRRFAKDELYLLIGTDILEHLVAGMWPNQDRLLESMTLVVGIRSDGFRPRVQMLLDKLQSNSLIIETDRPHASSRLIREALQTGKGHEELLDSLRVYAAEHWLYVSLEANSS